MAGTSERNGEDDLALAPRVASRARKIREEGFVDSDGKFRQPWNEETKQARAGCKVIRKMDRIGIVLSRIARAEEFGFPAGYDAGSMRDLSMPPERELQ